LLSELRDQIDAGKLAAQSAFPSERTLAETHAVGRSAVRWAVDVLQREGLIRSVGSRTRIVCSVSEPSGLAAQEPNLSNTGLRIGAQAGLLSDTVAVLAGEDVGEYSRPGVSAPGWGFYVAHGAMHELHSEGLHVMRINRTSLTLDEVSRFAAGRIRAVIVPEYTTLDRGMLDGLAAAHVPTVVAGDRTEAQDFDRVVSDHAAGAADEVRWLVAQGRQRIVQLMSDGFESVYWLRDRRRGYERAMRESGLEPLPPLIVHREVQTQGNARDRGETERQARFLAGYLVQASRELRPEALLLFSDENVAAAALACRYCGLDPDRGVALAGYDNFWTEHWTQRIACFAPQVTVDKRNWEIRQELARLALARAAGTLPVAPQRRLVKPLLLPVQTTMPIFKNFPPPLADGGWSEKTPAPALAGAAP
jgi:DNA-binding LacI/PurR family transcriptional regulator